MIKCGYAPAPVQADPSAYSLPDQPINHCYDPAFTLVGMEMLHMQPELLCSASEWYTSTWQHSDSMLACPLKLWNIYQLISSMLALQCEETALTKTSSMLIALQYGSTNLLEN